MQWWWQVLLMEAFWWVARRLSPARACAMGRRLLGRFGPRTGKHRHVLANLRTAFPEYDEQRIQALGRAVWSNLGATLAEYPHLGTLADFGRPAPAIEIVFRGLNPDEVRAGAPWIFVAAHLANWELAVAAVQHSGLTVDVVYNPQINPYLEKAVQRERRALGCEFIERGNAARRLYRSLRQGRSVGLLVDYRIDGAELFPFFGVAAPTTTAPAWLAKKTGCDILPVQMERLPDARFRATFHSPLRTGGRSPEEITTEINRRIAALIAANPGQWLCTKRRWSKDAMRKRGAYRP